MHARPAIPQLTSLRFFAALHVVLFHNLYLYGDSLQLPLLAKNFVSIGFTAVYFFFILSGFILAYVYGETLAGGRHGWGLSAFWAKRIARIYPLFFLGMMLDAPRVFSYFLGTGGLFAGTAKIFTAAGANLLLIQAWFPRIAPTWNSPGWSLSDEAFFYLLFPFAALRIRGMPAKYLPIFLIALALFSLLIILPFVLALDPTAKNSTWGTMARYNPILHLAEFVFGIGLERLFSLHKFTLKWGFIAGVLGIVLVAWISPRIPILFLHNGAMTPIFGVLIFSVASGNGFLSGCLNKRSLVLLGNSSYALYILHQHLKTYIVWLAARPGLGPSPLLFGSYLTVILAASIFAHLLIEEPARKRLQKISEPIIDQMIQAASRRSGSQLR